MSIGQADRAFKIDIPVLGVTDKISLEEFKGEDGLSRPFLFHLRVTSLVEDLDPVKAVGESVDIEIATQGGEYIPFHGMINKFTRVRAPEDSELFQYRIEVVPAFEFLKHSSINRIFAEQSPVDIIKQVLGEFSIKHEVKADGHGTQKLEYCVQYGESDFNFVSRLMEENGLYYFHKHAKGEHKMVIAGGISAYEIAKEKDVFFEGNYDLTDSYNVLEIEKESRFIPAKYFLEDEDYYRDFDKVVTKNAPTKSKISAIKKYEILEYPAGYDFFTVDGGSSDEQSKWPKERMEALEIPGDTLSGKGLCVSWFPGYKFTYDKTEYVVTSIKHEYLEPFGSDLAADDDGKNTNESRFHNYFEAIPAANCFRPLRTTPMPKIYGIQSASVADDGNEGSSKNFGEIKVTFPWDTENQSRWVRVMTMWAGVERGNVFLPRIGDEVLISYVGGDPDRPVVVGSVYNNKNTIPPPQPDEILKQGIWTENQYGRHEFWLDDTEDKELVTLQSTLHYNKIVFGNETVEIGSQAADPGSQEVTIEKDRTVTLNTGNDTLTVSEGSQETTIETDRTTTINSGDDKLEVSSGSREETIETDLTTTVNSGDLTVEASQGDMNYTASLGDITIDASAGEVTITAAQKITLEVGANSIVIDTSSITIDGITVELTGQAQATVGAPMVTVEGDAMTEVSGGVVMIN